MKIKPIMYLKIFKSSLETDILIDIIKAFNLQDIQFIQENADYILDILHNIS